MIVIITLYTVISLLYIITILLFSMLNFIDDVASLILVMIRDINESINFFSKFF